MQDTSTQQIGWQAASKTGVVAAGAAEAVAAVTAPRFATAHHQDSFDPDPERERTFIREGSLIINAKVDQGVRDEMARRGHQVTAMGGPIAFPVMLYADPASGVYYAAGDPAAGRHAAGLAELRG